MLETREDPASTDDPVRGSPPEPAAAPATLRPTPRERDARQPPPSRPPGFKLGKASGPEARDKAQAILDDTLTELRRLDGSQQTLARDVYMRGHSAAERVEDELDPGDEPALLKLRAHEDAMKAELRRIYGADDADKSTARP